MLPAVLLVGLILLGGVLHSSWPTAIALAVAFGAAGTVLAVIRPEVPDPFEYRTRAVRAATRLVAAGVAAAVVGGFAVVAVHQGRPDAFVNGILSGLIWVGLPGVAVLTLVTHVRRHRGERTDAVA